MSMLLVTLRRALVAVGLLVGRSGDCSESGVMLLRDKRGDVPDRDGVGLVVVAGVDRDATSSSASLRALPFLSTMIVPRGSSIIMSWVYAGKRGYSGPRSFITSSTIFLRAIMCAVPSSSRMPLWRKVPPLPPSVIQFLWPAWYSSMRFAISSSSAFDCRQYASKLEYFMGTSI